MNQTIKNYLIPFLFAILIFLVVRPTLAQLAPDTPKDVGVGEEVNKGYMRVFYTFGREKVFVSQENQNSKHSDASGDYIVWVTEIADGPGQIFLYQISTGLVVQITHTGSNQRPRVNDDGNVVWAGWRDDYSTGSGWQAFLFKDGSVRQLTSGDSTVNVDINNDYVTYARQDVKGDWRAVVYSISRDEFQEISFGPEAKIPEIADGKILLNSSEFPLTVEDLFLVDLPPLTLEEPETVSVEEIEAEIEAEPSVLPSPTPTLAPEASLSPEPEGQEILETLE